MRPPRVAKGPRAFHHLMETLKHTHSLFVFKHFRTENRYALFLEML